MRIGIVIQGARTSFGQVTGPNQTPKGFDAHETILDNIVNFTPLVDKIVVSTWEGSEFDFKEFKNVVLLENRIPENRDFDNRNKQFISTYEGCKWLSNNTDVTHILKIRTDQFINPDIIDWMRSFYSEWSSKFGSANTTQESYIVFSEYIQKGFNFYVGDYLFAGTTNDMVSFCKNNVLYGSKKLHPQINADFVLKHLSRSDKGYSDVFFSWVPCLWQSANPSNIAVSSYWKAVRCKRFAFISKDIFSNIIWRGRRMSDVIPSYGSAFGFYDDWIKEVQSNIKISSSKNWSSLLPNKHSLKEVKYEYLQLVTKYLKYHWLRYKKSIK